MLPERISGIWLRIKALFLRRQLERDLGDELEFHLAMREQKLVEQGMPPEEAHYAARRAFGNTAQAKESNRELWTFPVLETLAQDIRYGLRQLRRNPGFTIVAIITLALGIGATTAMFSIIYCVFVVPFPFAHSHRLVGLVSWNKKVEGQFGAADISAAELEDYRKHSHVFDDVAGSTFERVLVTGISLPESWIGSRVTGNYFRLLGVPPLLGRAVTPQDDKAGAPAVAVLGYTVWQSTFGGDPKVLGRTIVLNQQPATIIGVMPRRFGGKVWISTGLTGAVSASRGVPFEMTARLKAGVSLEQAQAEVAALSGRFASVYPKDHPPDMAFKIRRLDRDVRQFDGPWLVLLGAVGLLLLIACVNLANLLLARARARERETAVRMAVGATRGRLVRQFIVESMLLALSGVALGCLLAAGLVAGLWPILHSAFGYYIRPETVIRINGPVLLFTLGTAFLSTLLFGLAPALLATGSNIQGPLKTSGSRTGGDRGHHWLRSVLVISEVMLSLVLLTGAGLLIHSFFVRMQVNLGYSPNNVLFATVGLPEKQYKTADQIIQFDVELLRRVRGLPGVVSAALGFPPPPHPFHVNVETNGKNRAASRAARFYLVGDAYFKTMGIRLLQGRRLSEEDVVQRRQIAVVNRTFATQNFGGEDPLGKQIKLSELPSWLKGPDTPLFEVVGVVADIKDDWSGPEKAPHPEFYLPTTVYRVPAAMIFLRTAVPPASLSNPVRREVADINKDLPVEGPYTMQWQLDGNWYAQPRVYLVMLAGFGGLGLLLACVGVYGVLSFAVSQRTQEIGVRMALGAQVSDVRRMVLKWGLRWLAVGIGIGVPASIALAKVLRNRIWGIQSADPLTFVAVSLVLIAVALVACYIPARRAAKVDPMVALRYE
jgi:putative ABC transport system permease protein